MPSTVLLPGNSGVTVHMRLYAIWGVTKMEAILVEQTAIREDNL